MDAEYPFTDDPPRFRAWLFEKVRQIPGYTWDDSITPTHSTYQDWYIWGERDASEDSSKSIYSPRPSGESSRSSTHGRSPSVASSRNGQAPQTRERVVTRLSRHALRLERQYQLGKTITAEADPDHERHLRFLRLLRIAPRNDKEPPLAVIICADPGYNELREYANFGPNWYRADESPATRVWKGDLTASGRHKSGQMPLEKFLDFAIGAAQCCEMLHQGTRLVHGELRGDAFGLQDGRVKLINFGSGVRAFENGLSSAGWKMLSQETGVEYKLHFIAPEQTGRLPAAPDSRTDIYSLGILFYNLLTGELPFPGSSPLDIMQNVLSRRVPPLSTKRIDIPDALSAIVARMVAKNINDRYNSAGGLKQDLRFIQKLLAEGDIAALKVFEVGTRDVNSYFTLPNIQIGREEERGAILNVIDRVSKYCLKVKPASNAPILTRVSSTSSVSDGQPLEQTVSGTGSSAMRSTGARFDSIDEPTLDQDPFFVGIPASVSDVSARSPSEMDPRAGGLASGLASPNRSLEKRMSNDGPRSMVSGLVSENAHRASLTSGHSVQESGLLFRTPGDRYQRKGRCEIITISGVAGLGKTSLIQSIQPVAREQGYFANAKFDQARRTPFGPVLHVMASLFRQIFSESDVNTDFHHSLRSFVRPVWPLLSNMLSLPEWLLSTSNKASVRATAAYGSQASTPTPSLGVRRSSSPHKARVAGPPIGGLGSTTSDFLRTGASAKSSRFMAIFLDVLRFFSSHRFILLCLDDIQFADEESVELFYGIAQSKIPIAIILTFREHATLQPRIKSLIEGSLATVTSIQLRPLTEDQVAEYVSSTLRRSKDYLFPLVAVIVERTGGNPFFVREMLDACYRRNCLWYSWQDSEWKFELDKVFATFTSEAHGAQMNNDFILTKIQELPETTRNLLAWASLLGSTFLFSMVKSLMNGTQADSSPTEPHDQHAPSTSKIDLVRQSSQNAVRGLQAAIASYIVMPGEDDDHFAFCHDRYQQAALSLIDSSKTQEMHFSIAQIMSNSNEVDEDSNYDKASHICACIHLIKARIDVRAPYRDILFQAAERATESGGRSAGSNYFTNALALLQKNPWDDTLPDVSYQETLTLFTRAAEGYWVQGHVEPAMALLQTTFRKAKDAVDKVPSYILQSRIMARRGDNSASFRVMKQCLADLGVPIPDTTWEQCDAEFHQLALEIGDNDKTMILQRNATEDPQLLTVGSVLCEILHSSFWVDPLFFYQLALIEVRFNLHMAVLSTSGLGYIHLATCAIGRFKMVEYGWHLAEIGRKFINRFESDVYAMGRGKTIYSLLVGHFGMHSRALVTILESGLEASLLAGDRMFSILGAASIATNKLWSSVDLVEVESFCAYGSEEIVNWQEDLHGGLQLTAVRQLARALQGKTATESADTVFTDDQHNTGFYLEWITRRSPNPRKVVAAYKSWQSVGLFLFGHYKAAVALDEPLVDESQVYWSSRQINVMPFYVALSYMAVLREHPTRADRTKILPRVRALRERFMAWSAISDVNYGAWTYLLTAQLCELDADYAGILIAYEAGLDCAEVHGFTFEQGLINELYGEYLIRRGANRPAKNAISDAIAAYRRFSAFGKAQQLFNKHEWLLMGTSSLTTVDVACQTDAAIMDIHHPPEAGFNEEARQIDAAMTAHRTQEWLDPSKEMEDRSQQGLEGLGLDMIDLAGILRSSQVLSSELQVEKLLAKMSEVIRQSTTAELCAIVVEEGDEGWRVANVNDAAGNEYPSAQTLDDVEDVIGKQIALYSLRFKEMVFLPNVSADDRFSNLSEAYRKRNPHGKAVIAMPILRGDDMTLGCVYLEGPPNSFTERNVTVLRLLVNSVSISIANAMLFKRVEKVSASNATMIESQKKALAQAREAEKKARIAEADAVKSAKLKEEAIKAKQGFLANVSHELRTPLNGVIGMSELLKASQLSNEQEGYADSIRVCADTLLTVINDILDYSKLEAGKMQMFSVPLNLTETISEVVRALSFTNLQKDLKTIMKLDIDTGRNRPLLVMGDPVRLHQILMNLLSNAYKFTAQGSVTVRGVIDFEDDNAIAVTVSVIDTGVGITPEQQKRLFLPFSQADNSTARSYGGTGLGLSICKAIIENVMTGRIWLESTQGAGTNVSFSLRFPKVRRGGAPVTTPGGTTVDGSSGVFAQEPDPMAIFSPPATDSSPAGSGRGILDLAAIPPAQLRICIAEDNPINQKIALSYVQKMGYRCAAFNDGRQAVDALARDCQTDPFHIVLMDVQMPVLDGYDATREIRRSNDPIIRDVLVIAMTASAIRGDREKCLEAGMNNYLAKPVRALMLKQMLASYLTHGSNGGAAASAAAPLTDPSLAASDVGVEVSLPVRSAKPTRPPLMARQESVMSTHEDSITPTQASVFQLKTTGTN